MKFYKLFHISKPKLILLIGILGVLFLVGMLTFVIVSSSQTVKPVVVNKADVKLDTSVPHVENELVIRYEEGKSTADLQKEIARRDNLSKSQIGRVRLNLENILLNVSDERSPEEEYDEIQNIFAQTGVIKQTKMYSEEALPLKNYYVLTFKAGTDLVIAQEIINKSSLFSFAQGNYIAQPFREPNDPEFSRQWGFTNISAPQAWDLATGSRTVTVAVIDSGIEQSHPDMPSGIIEGPDYAGGTSSFDDTMGHGTLVGGIIGAATDNGIGVAGTNWNVQLMAIKVCTVVTPQPPDFRNTACTDVGVVQGIVYASNNDARVINMSLGDKRPCSANPMFRDAINVALSQESVIVAAAGNNQINTDTVTPASCPGVLAVGAIDKSNQRSRWPSAIEPGSNYGPRVDIAAPGTEVLSTYKGKRYEAGNGTSFAAPFVSGAAALLLSVNPDLKQQQVKDCIVNSGDPISTDLPVGGKKLNVLRMLQQCGNVAAATDTPTLTPSQTPTITTTGTPSPSPTEIPGTTNSPTVTTSPTPTSTGVPKTSTPTVPVTTPTPTGTVVQLYDCQPRTEKRIVDGKPIQISWLDCKPIQ